MAKEGKDACCDWEFGYEEKNNSNCSIDQCSTRKIVKTKCKIEEEVETGRFIKKCEKTEQFLKDCVGKPVELVKSTTEYTNEDVTNEKSRWFIPLVESELKTNVHSDLNSFSFPGLRDDIETIEKNVFGGLSRFRDDIETIEKNVFGGLSRFLEAVEEKVSSFDKIFESRQHNDGDSSSSSSFRQKIPIESHLEKEKETSGEQRNDNNKSIYSEFAGQIKDV